MRSPKAWIWVWITTAGCGVPNEHREAVDSAPTQATTPVEAAATIPTWASDPALAEDEIEREATTAVAREHSTSASTADLRLGLVACRALWLIGDRGAAAEGYRALIRAWPEELLPRVAYARLLLEGADGVGAADTLVPVAGQLDRLPDGRWLLGVAEIHGGSGPRGVALLREELVDGARFREAALSLSEHFAQRDLHGEAIAVIRAALRRAPGDYWLRLCTGRLHFEIARWDLAREHADTLVTERPGEPRARLLLADVAQAQGDLATTRAALEELLGAERSQDPMVLERRDTLETRLAALAEVPPGRPPPMTADALLALIRGAEFVGQRLTAYRALAADPRTHRRATQVALHQEDAVVRVVAVRSFRTDDEEVLADLLEQLADDPDPRVRGAVSVRAAADLPATRSIRFLSKALDAEDDPYAFRCAHLGLRRALGPLVQMSDADADSPAERERVRREWRQLCPD